MVFVRSGVLGNEKHIFKGRQMKLQNQRRLEGLIGRDGSILPDAEVGNTSI